MRSSIGRIGDTIYVINDETHMHNILICTPKLHFFCFFFFTILIKIDKDEKWEMRIVYLFIFRMRIEFIIIYILHTILYEYVGVFLTMS